MNSFSYKLLALPLGMVQSLVIEIDTDLGQPIAATHLNDGLPFLNADPNTVTVSG